MPLMSSLSVNIQHCLIAAVLCVATPTYAADLLQIYDQALHSAPSLKSDHATSQAGEEAFPISLGSLLPQLSVSADATAAALRSGVANANYTATGYVATLTQTVFDANQFSNVGAGAHNADAAQDTFKYQQQQFVLDVAKRYFAVLEAEDNVTFSQAKAEFLLRTLDQTREKLNVGLATQTDYLLALANYDQAVSEVIANRNTLANSRESLREITGTVAPPLASLKSGFPFEAPKPADMDYWVKQALQHNYQLLAARETADGNLYSAYAAVGNQLPKVSLQATYTYNDYSVNVPAVVSTSQRSKDLAVGLNLTWNIFSGGAQFATSVQAAHTYASSDATAQNTYRDVERQTRSDYRGVLAQIAQVRALQQSVISAKASVAQFEAQYRVGTSTIVGVLNQLQRLFQFKQQLAQAQYQYILSVLSLKLDAGTLSRHDLLTLNNWLQIQTQAKS